jgi:hypothetical protein
MTNWFNLEWPLLMSLWGGCVGYFFVCKSVDNPKNIWFIPSLYFMIFTVPTALVDINIGLLTLAVTSAIVMKWSLT